jgi:hypothetical protein
MDEGDFKLNILNNYIEFYKSEIQNSEIFENINYTDFSDTNKQIEMLYISKEEYELNIEFINKIDECDPESENYKKYIITKNNIKILTCESLFSLLIELANLKIEDKKNKYNIILRDKIKKVKIA